MEETQLTVEIRREIGGARVRRVLREGNIPAVVYGGGRPPTTIKLDRQAYERVRRQHRGETLLFHLEVREGGKKLRDYAAVVVEEQHDPVGGRIRHIDFKRVSLKEKIEVRVPVVAKGEAVGVKRDGGSLEHSLWEIRVACLPAEIPEHIEVDIGPLEIGDSLQVKDLPLPPGVTATHDPEAVVFAVVPPMAEETGAAQEEAEEPEIVGKKKSVEKEAAPETE